MKLLVLTQAVDNDHPVLGFFHQWLVALAARYEIVHVVCLFEGKHDLPGNVYVHSLGKEKGLSRIGYMRNFYRYVWSLRKEYDAVFVHMNQEYVLLGGIVWKLLGKSVYLWRNFYSGNVLTDLAALICTGVFCTSRSSYTAKYKKTVLMPVGVDVTLYEQNAAPESVRRARSIVSLGRISPDKRIDLLIGALAELKKSSVAFSADIYGDAAREHEAYMQSLQTLVQAHSLSGEVTFLGPVPHHATPEVYSAHEIFVNMSPSGMYDKTIFEAAASGCLVITSIKDFREVGEEFYFDETMPALLKGLTYFLSASEEEKHQMRNRLSEAVESNTLDALVQRLVTEIQ